MEGLQMLKTKTGYDFHSVTESYQTIIERKNILKKPQFLLTFGFAYHKVKLQGLKCANKNQPVEYQK